MLEIFEKKISDLKNLNLFRKPKSPLPNSISFCSNDYLGLSQNKEVIESAKTALNRYGFGSKSSRYIQSDNHLYDKMENLLSNMKGTEDAIIFGSGYLAGTSIISALLDKNDIIIADKLIHSCLIDGSRLSGAKMIRFKHNDINHAREIVKKYRPKYKKCLIITETVFSMDGDLGIINELLELSLKHNCFILSDDAHGMGILKQKYPKKFDNIHIQMGTMSKAVGGYGGYACSNKTIIDYLRNFAKSTIYSTSLPSSTLAGNLKSLEIINNDKKLGKLALDNANYFCKLMDLPQTKSCIVVLITKDITKTLKIAENAKNIGYSISAIRPPTVEKGKSRIRITFNANHKKSDIKKLADFLNQQALIYS